MKKLKNSELNRKSISEFKKSKKIPTIIILENIRSAHNVGAVFRNSDAFIIERIILCGITPCPPNRQIAKTALGATDSIKWEYEEKSQQIIKKLKKEGYSIISIEQVENSTRLENFKIEKHKKIALIFGNEINGVEQESINMSDEVVEIPQYGTKHSLNISVCSGIILWEIFKNNKNNY